MRGLPQEAVLADMVRDVSWVNVSTCARAHCSCTVCTPMACMAHSPGSVAARLSSCDAHSSAKCPIQMSVTLGDT